jgi:hypothetical protein
MLYMLLGEVIAVGGFLAVQVGGLVGRAGRILSWAAPGRAQAERLDASLRGFYREDWRRFLVSVAPSSSAGWPASCRRGSS